MRRRLLLGGALAAGLPGPFARAQDITFFRILTGGTVGTYFPIGGLIANAISNPPGSRPCGDGGSCGVPGLVATSVASNGSVANAAAIGNGTGQSGFVQSDVAFWAYSGTGIYDGRPRIDNLRAIANLYSESVHLVARRGSGIKTVADLRGKRVSLDEPGSGTLVDARLILAAYQLGEKDIKPAYFRAQRVADHLKDGGIDAFFSVSGWPQSSVSELAATVGVDVVPIAGPEAAKLCKQYPFFGTDFIPADTYQGVPATPTIGVHALWVTSAKQPDDLIYKIVTALWDPSTRKLLDSGHVKGRDIKLETALSGLAIPLHPGAERFYREKGMLK